MAASAQTEWIERVGYSVRSNDFITPDIVTLRIVTPSIANSGGYYIQPGIFDPQTSLKAYTALDEAGNEWEQRNVTTPRAVMRSALNNKSNNFSDLTCLDELPSPEATPVQLYLDTAFAITNINTNPQIPVDPLHEFSNLRLQTCTLKSEDNKLAITFEYKSLVNTISQCAGVLDLTTGKITRVVDIEQTGRIAWIDSNLVAIVLPNRHGTAWSIVDFEKKKVVSTGLLKRKVGWIIFKRKIHVWIPEPMSIPIYEH